jgi:hypothetical protein
MSVLSERETALFTSMQKRDQRHAIEVATRLRAGPHDDDLLVAALLHDCGKGEVPVWLRILKVVSPDTLERVARDDESGWRNAAHRLLDHEALSVQLAREAGVSEGAVRLIAGTPLADEEWKAARLMAADDAS